ncbi:hypothetical protein EIP86_004915 [Pleurotus ostreatoroseus]|nr:hypothetical protein EIP86_004915 [Pleurotus ostreatoroseus]
MELREDYGDPLLGTCDETLIGGNHFRYGLYYFFTVSVLTDSLSVFRQNGAEADSGALFLAVSAEEDLENKHTIAADGYNKGRDALVQAAAGRSSYDGVTYSTTAQTLAGVMPSGSTGVNHGAKTETSCD